MLLTFTYGTEYFGRQLEEISYLEGFQEGMKMHVMSHIKECSPTTYRILLVELGELPIELYIFSLL